MSVFNLREIQKMLFQQKIDGWFFYDFQGSDPIGRADASDSIRTNPNAPLVLFYSKRRGSGQNCS